MFLQVAPAGAIIWEEPVEAPVVDSYRPPSSPYGAGNRGLEYDLEPGTSILAVDDGRVSFVGMVGNASHITISHGDGLKSTYAFVATAHVVRGQIIKRGQVVATAGPGFHLTARFWGDYVDPGLLFGGAEVEVNLIGGHSVARAAAPSERYVAPRSTIRNWDPFSQLLGD